MKSAANAENPASSRKARAGKKTTAFCLTAKKGHACRSMYHSCRTITAEKQHFYQV